MMIVPQPKPDQKIQLRPALRKKADQLLDNLIKEFYSEVPYATHFMTASKAHPEYYKRHTIETILRLRMKRTVDALAIKYFTLYDPIRAQAWCQYGYEEMLHDIEYFMNDLNKIGVSAKEVYETEPLFSTKLLTGYYQWGMEYEKCPLALISSVYFMEYTTTRTQPEWIDNLEKSMGADAVAGARGHVNLDIDDGHDEFVWEVLMSLINSKDDEMRMLDHLRNVGRLFAMYFTELHHLTVDGKSAVDLKTMSEGMMSVQAAE